MQAQSEAGASGEHKEDESDEKQRCSVGILIKKDSKGNLKVRGFATGGPAERCGKIKVCLPVCVSVRARACFLAHVLNSYKTISKT